MKDRRETKLYFDQELWDWLKNEATRRKSSVSQVARDLVIDEIGRREQKERQNEEH